MITPIWSRYNFLTIFMVVKRPDIFWIPPELTAELFIGFFLVPSHVS